MSKAYDRFFQATTLFAAGCVFADFAITVIFYPVMKIVVNIIWVSPHSDIKFENMLKIFQKLGQTFDLPDFFNNL